MRKIVAGFASSLDGYIEGPDSDYDWILIDKEIDFTEQAKRFDTYFYGRRTYEVVSPAGTRRSAGIRNYVFSNTLTSVHHGYTLVNGHIKEKVMEIKEQAGNDIALFGGASLLASLLDLKLVDEISVAVIPVLLGNGKPMVDVLSKRVWLKLETYKKYANSTIQLTYTVHYKTV